MATLYTQQSNNVTKTWLLITLFIGIVSAVGYALSLVYHSQGIVIIAFVISLAMSMGSYWYSDVIALRTARAIPAPHDQYRHLHTTVENLCITAGMPVPAIYIIPDASPNAFATGRNAKHASIAVTVGLLELLDQSELEGVIAHELSHIKNNDILLQSMVAVLVGFIALVTDMITQSMFWGGFRRREDDEGSGIELIIGIVLIIVAPIVALLIQLAISRKREYLADASAALMTRYPEGLARALQKIEQAAIPMTHASNATAHMYISNPFAHSWRARISELFATHPPTKKRIAALLGTPVEALS